MSIGPIMSIGLEGSQGKALIVAPSPGRHVSLNPNRFCPAPLVDNFLTAYSWSVDFLT
jgi:hypothetical protein